MRLLLLAPSRDPWSGAVDGCSFAGICDIVKIQRIWDFRYAIKHVRLSWLLISSSDRPSLISRSMVLQLCRLIRRYLITFTEFSSVHSRKLRKKGRFGPGATTIARGRALAEARTTYHHRVLYSSGGIEFRFRAQAELSHLSQ